MRGLFVFLVACAGQPKPVVMPLAKPVPKLDDATVIAKSKAFFSAIDTLDVAAATEPLAPSFVFFEDARFSERAVIRKMVQGRIDRHAAPRTRTWSDEHVFVTESSAIFIADAIEHIPAEGDQPAADFDGYNTLVWVREGATWRIAEWQWSRGGIDAERDRWNERFRTGLGFNHAPNQLLVDTLKGRKPGRALDLLMGQGRNAIYEASQGWKVTGVDISDEGIRIAKDEAARDKLELEAIEANVDTWDLGKDRWDLVTMIYAGDDVKLIEKIKPSLKKGGLFVLEYFHAESDAGKSGAGGWKSGALAALFKDGYKILRDEVVEDTADYSMRKQKLVRFVAEKL